MIDPDLLGRFIDPPAEYGPTPLWWWSGGRVTEDGIDAQLERFTSGGVFSLVIINLAPAGPTYGAMPDDPVWFSERWWELFAYTCKRARELGVTLWIYDQLGFSGANLQGRVRAAHPEVVGRSLRSAVVHAGAEGRLEHAAGDHSIAAYRMEAAGDEGWAPLELDGDRAVGVSEGEQVRLVTWRETAFDYLSPSAVELLIDTVHGEFARRVPEYLGSTVVGTFQDEMAPMPTWSDTFEDRFHAMHGYRLHDWFPALWELDSDRGSQVRADYHRTRTALAEDAFFRPLADWHRRHGMHIGADQQNPARAGFPTQGVQLYADYFATHRWYDAVGSDHQGDARIHSSMADLYDHARVWIEAFHSTGWGGTLDEIWDWLIPFFRSGGDLYNPHASYFTLRAGWFEWAPPSTDFRQPYWAIYPDFARAVARVAALSAWGRHAVDVAVLYPSEAAAADLPPDLVVDHFGTTGELGAGFEDVDNAQRSYFALVGKNDFFDPRPGALDQAGIDFDVIDGDSLAAAVASDAVTTANGLRFRVVVLPRMARIRAEVARRLVQLLDGGGHVVVVGSAPRAAIGSGDAGPVSGPEDLAAVAALAAHPRLDVVADASAAVEAVGADLRPVRAPLGARARVAGDYGVAIVPLAFPNATRRPDGYGGDGELSFGQGLGEYIRADFDPERYADGTRLEIAGVVAEAEIWNPATGERRPAVVHVDGKRSVVVVEGRGAPLLLVAWRLGEAAPAAPAPADGARAPQEIATHWTQELVPTLDNRFGDFALPAGPEPLPLEAWTATLVRDGGRERVRVGFGQEVLLLPPTEPGIVPTVRPDTAESVRRGADLGDDRWEVQRFSSWRGPNGTATTNLRGFVEEEFLVHPTPAPGQEVGMRCLLRVPEPGDYELTLSAPLRARVWVDGVEAVADGEGRHTTVMAHFGERVAVIEYRLQAPGAPARNPLGLPVWSTASAPPATFGVSLSVHLPGTRVAIPEFMTPGDRGLSQGKARFRRSFTSASAAQARIVTGGTCALRVLLDGRERARQERVQYYEDGIGANPSFFAHDLGVVPAGDHLLEIIAVDAPRDTPIFVDLLLDGADPEVVVSGPGWAVGDGHPVGLRPGLGGGTGHARVARRAHPLVPAEWLTGPPELGVSAVPFECAVSAQPREHVVEVEAPVGTTALDLGVDVVGVTVDGHSVTVAEDGVVRLDAPLQTPATVRVSLPPRVFSGGAAAWTRPIRFTTAPAPARFEDWKDQGLRAWSGAVRYTASVELDRPGELRLDLGDVRGAVALDVDGVPSGTAFCRPFAFRVPDVAAGAHQLAVTVYGTLGPRYAEATPSVFVTEPQRSTGLCAPIRVEVS